MPRRDEPAKVSLFRRLGVDLADTTNPTEYRGQCPFCNDDGEGKFYVNVEEGLYHCKKCDEQGNIVAFLTWFYQQRLQQTDADDRKDLAQKLGVGPQTIHRHGLAVDSFGQTWYIPFRNAQGNIVNLQRYLPDKPKPNKFNLPGLPLSIYNFDQFVHHKERIAFVCEGVSDALALDDAIGHKHRARYSIIATPGGFSDSWADYFQGVKLRLLYDNDEAGEKHRERALKLLAGERRIADEVRYLKWPETIPQGWDIRDFVRQYSNVSVVDFLNKHCVKHVTDSKLRWSFGWDGPCQEEKIDWVWPHRIRCGSYCSLSGRGGSFKSTLMRDCVARYTRGDPWPECHQATMRAGYVVYLFAEETEAKVRSSLVSFGTDMSKVILLHAVQTDDQQLNVLEQLDGIREMIRDYGVRLLIIDGQNSVVGAPCIATDMLARFNVTNKLHQFAIKENIALVGIRNEDEHGRALGPQSMADLARCILRTENLEDHPDHPGTHFFRLHFKKVSDAPKSLHPSIPYAVTDDPSGLTPPKILWGKSRPGEQVEAIVTEEQAQGLVKLWANRTPEEWAKVQRNGQTEVETADAAG